MHLPRGPGNGPPFADRALAALRHWPALTECPADSGAGIGLAAGSLQIVHLHLADEAELYLTWPVILRLGVALAGTRQVRFAPGDDWVIARLATEGDVTTLTSLVSVAIQANALAARQPGHPPAPCPRSPAVEEAHMSGFGQSRR
jgi:hypothetical protein